jgi:hypothetical protein
VAAEPLAVGKHLIDPAMHLLVEIPRVPELAVVPASVVRVPARHQRGLVMVRRRRRRRRMR